MNVVVDDPGYGAQLLELFARPEHAGVLPAGEGAVYGEAGSRTSGASVRLWLRIYEGRIATARFQAYGCPYLLAAAEALCRWLAHRERAELDRWHWRMAEAELAAPPEKRTRLLLLEDALLAAVRAWDASAPP